MPTQKADTLVPETVMNLVVPILLEKQSAAQRKYDRMLERAGEYLQELETIKRDLEALGYKEEEKLL